SEADGHMAMVDEPIKMRGSSVIKWAEGNRYLVESGSWQMADMDPAQMTMLWTYDTNKKAYRVVWAESIGVVGMGHCTYDEATRTWHWEGHGETPFGKMRDTGEMKFVDDNTAQIKMTGYSGMMKVMEMTGTMKRKG